MLSISELIKSSANVKGFSSEDTFGRKKFGEIYLYNKKVKVKPKSSIIEVSMMIKGATQKIKTRGGEQTVAAHRVMVAINNVEQESYTPAELVTMIRKENSNYKDTEKFTNEDILEIVNSTIWSSSKATKSGQILQDRTIFQGEKGNYIVIKNKIPDSSKIQVWCSCSSYYWVFQYYNILADANIKSPGRPIKMETYKYKTKKGLELAKKGKPMRNPKKSPGLCKHLMLLLAMLLDSRVVSPVSKSSQTLETQYFVNIDKFKFSSRLNQESYDKLIRDFDKDRRKVIAQRKSYASWTDLAGSQRTNRFFNKSILESMR